MERLVFMTNENEQAVTDNANQGEAVPSSEVDNSAQGTTEAENNNNAADNSLGLDELLSQFDDNSGDNQTQQAQAVQPTQTSQDGSSASGKDAIAEQLYQADLNNLMDEIRGDLDPEKYDDTFMEAFITSQAKKNPNLHKAWDERHTNRGAFKKVTNALREQFGRNYVPTNVDPKASENAALVADAVKNGGNSTKQVESAVDYKGMTDGQFSNDVFNKYGYYPGV